MTQPFGDLVNIGLAVLGSVVLHKSEDLTITTPAKFFDKLRRKN